jgi:phosphoglucomutase
VDSDAANAMMEHLRNPDFMAGIVINGYTLTGVDDFSYVDPVDGSKVRCGLRGCSSGCVNELDRSDQLN